MPTEQFLYDRNQGTQMSAYIQSDIQEEDESMESVSIKFYHIRIEKTCLA